jgi:hypothetical protein
MISLPSAWYCTHVGHLQLPCNCHVPLLALSQTCSGCCTPWDAADCTAGLRCCCRGACTNPANLLTCTWYRWESDVDVNTQVPPPRQIHCCLQVSTDPCSRVSDQLPAQPMTASILLQLGMTIGAQLLDDMLVDRICLVCTAAGWALY